MLTINKYLIEEFVLGSYDSSAKPDIHHLVVTVKLPNHTHCIPAEQEDWIKCTRTNHLTT